MVRGCKKFVPALAYLFCLALPWYCLARFAHYLAGLCSRQYQRVGYVIYTDLLLKVALDWSTWIQWIGHPPLEQKVVNLKPQKITPQIEIYWLEICCWEWGYKS